MCGRATLTVPAEEVAKLFDVEPIDIGPPRFNIAPTQPMVTVRAKKRSHEEEGEPSGHEATSSEAGPSRELAVVRWGLIPWWAKGEDAKRLSSKFVQARAETAPKAAAFRDAFKRHRCLVVVDGFFEWKTLPDGRRVPHHVKPSHGRPFAIAGLWDSWRPPAEGPEAPKPERVESCAVVTTRAAGKIRELHDRMPLVLPANDWDTWLTGPPEAAADLLARGEDALDAVVRDFVAVPLSTWVNDVRHDDPRCVAPITLEETPADAHGQVDFAFAKGAKARHKRAPGRR